MTDAQPSRSENVAKSRTRRESIRLRLAIAIPVLMVLVPLILGVLHYRFLDETLEAAREGSAAASAVRDVLVQVYISTFIVCVISLLFGLGISWGISRPIRRLIHTTRRIATGDLSSTVPADSGDEFGDLGNSFNEMIASLNRIFMERNRYILECYTGGLLIADAEGHILAANTAAEQILGKSVPELVASSVTDILRDRAGTGPFEEIVQNALRNRQFVSSKEISIRDEEGHDFPLLITTSPLRDAAEGRSGVVINFRDLSEVKAFYRQITRADRLAAVGTLAAGVAHEIRNPLGSIKGLAQMLCEDGPDDSQTRRYAEVIVREVNRLDGVVRELLEFAQGDTQSLQPWNINQVLHEVVELARYQVPEEKLGAVKIREAYGEVPAFPLHSQRISRAFLNLLVNAFDASDPQSEIVITSRFEARGGDEKDEVIVTVENTGETISPENIERIFEPFFSTKATGTGLGLPIAYQAISSHGGSIDVRSRDGRTAFVVRFPVVREKTASGAT